MCWCWFFDVAFVHFLPQPVGNWVKYLKDNFGVFLRSRGTLHLGIIGWKKLELLFFKWSTQSIIPFIWKDRDSKKMCAKSFQNKPQPCLGARFVLPKEIYVIALKWTRSYMLLLNHQGNETLTSTRRGSFWSSAELGGGANRPRSPFISAAEKMRRSAFCPSVAEGISDVPLFLALILCSGGAKHGLQFHSFFWYAPCWSLLWWVSTSCWAAELGGHQLGGVRKLQAPSPALAGTF